MAAASTLPHQSAYILIVTLSNVCVVELRLKMRWLKRLMCLSDVGEKWQLNIFKASRHDAVIQLFQVHLVSWRKCIYCLILYLCCQQMELPSIQLLVPVQGESSWEDVTDVCMKWLTRYDVCWITYFCAQCDYAGYTAKMYSWPQCGAA